MAAVGPPAPQQPHPQVYNSNEGLRDGAAVGTSSSVPPWAPWLSETLAPTASISVLGGAWCVIAPPDRQTDRQAGSRSRG